MHSSTAAASAVQSCSCSYTARTSPTACVFVGTSAGYLTGVDPSRVAVETPDAGTFQL